MYDAHRPLRLLPPARSQQLERFLAEHRWSLSAVTATLVMLVVAKLGAQLQVHGAYLLGKATTLVAKTTTRMVGVQKWKDHSDNADRGTYLVGHHWNLVGLISPWGTRWLCWPLVMRLVPGLKGARQWIVGDAIALMSFWDAAIAAILEVTRYLGEAPVRVVADAYYAKARFSTGCARGIDVISRLRKDAVGWMPRTPALRDTRPQAAVWSQVAVGELVDRPDADPRTPHPVWRLTDVVFVVRDVWLRDVTQKVRVVVLEGAKEPPPPGQHGPGSLGPPNHRDLWGQILDRADDPRLETAFWPGGLPVYDHAGDPALRAPGLSRLLSVAPGPR